MSLKSFSILAVASSFRKEDVCHSCSQLIFKEHKIKAVGTWLEVDICVSSDLECTFEINFLILSAHFASKPCACP